MSRTTKSFLLFLVASAVSGCVASGAKFTRETPFEPGEALLYIFRPSGFTGIAQRPDVKVDGQNLGSLVSGSFFVKKLGIGRHEILLTGAGNPFTWNYPDHTEVVEIKTSGTYYYRYVSRSAMRSHNVIAHLLIPRSV